MKNKILNALPWVILVCIIATFIYGIRPMIVMSGSMEPSIKTGSVCFVNTIAEYNNVKEKDVITFDLAGANITHRAVEIKPEGIITKGDANDVKDLGIVTTDTFKGKVIGTIPYAGYVFYFMKENQKSVIPVAILILGLFFFLSILLNRKEANIEENNS